MKRVALVLSLIVLLAAGGRALALDVGSDGSDGALNLTGTGTTTIDLRNAVVGPWTTPGDGTGKGVYDSLKWAVVFKYSSVNIGTGRIVQFTNNGTDAPVIWLVQGDVAISGSVNLNGQAFQSGGTFSQPGPGGFRGGRVYLSAQSLGSAGMGPGGGGYNPASPWVGGGGGYGLPGSGTGAGTQYGNARLLPLIGGSGGGGYGGSAGAYGGGAGGGAILIAANGTITITGGVQALGGTPNYSGGGSGGGIRLIANVVTGSASGLLAYGGSGNNGNAGGVGRVRVEGNTVTLSGMSNPTYSLMFPLESNEAVIWPIAGSPTVRVATFAGLPVPLDPESEFNPPGDLLVVSTDSVDVGIEASNVPTALPRRWNVKLRMVLRSGDEVEKLASFAGGDSISSTWTVRVPPLPEADFVTVQARAYKP